MQKPAIAILVFLLTIGLWTPTAQAEHGGPVDGSWYMEEADGSRLTMTVTEHPDDTGYFTVVLHDTLSEGVCDPPAPVTVSDDDALYDTPSKTLHVRFDEFTCHQGSTMILPEGHEIAYSPEVVLDDLMLTDPADNIWYFAFPSAGFDGDPSTTERIPASDATVAAIRGSSDRFPAEHAADYAILSRDDTFPDSLAASGLSIRGPLLFTNTAELTELTRYELDRVLADGRTVYLLGGTAAISDATAQQVEAEGYRVKRLFGATRVQTSVAVAEEIRALNPDVTVAAIARAFGPGTAAWADSITGGGWAARVGAPILITPTDHMETAVKDWLEADVPTTTYLFGGTSALDQGVERLTPNAKRIAGPTRAHTAVEIATQLWKVDTTRNRSFVIIDGYAEGMWAFGLAGAGPSRKYAAPLLVVEPNNTPDVTREMVRSCGTQRVDLLLMGNSSIIDEYRRQELDAEDGKNC